MGGSIRLGKVLDFEIRLDYSWFVIFFLLSFTLARWVFPGPLYGIDPGVSWVLGIIAALLLFASVLVHELSHSVMARRYGIEVAGITLFIFGGVAQIKGEPKEPKEEFFIAGIGPVVSVVIGVFFFVLTVAAATAGLWREMVAVLHYLGMINIILAVFNMIPGFPLDGGRILRSVIWHFTGSLQKATRWASYAGQAFAWLLIAWGIVQVITGVNIIGGLWLVFIGWFLNGAAEAAYQQLLLRRALSGVAVAEVMSRHVPTIDADLRVPQFVEDYLLKREYTIYPVERMGHFVGVVTLEDVRKLDRETWGSTSVGSLAHPPEQERVVQSHQDAWEALTQMMENDHQRLLVMENGHLEGIVSRESIFNLVQRKMRLGLSS